MGHIYLEKKHMGHSYLKQKILGHNYLEKENIGTYIFRAKIYWGTAI